jgi:hypothetical protein
LDTIRILGKNSLFELQLDVADSGFEGLPSRAVGDAAYMLQEAVNRLAIHYSNHEYGKRPRDGGDKL